MVIEMLALSKLSEFFFLLSADTQMELIPFKCHGEFIEHEMDFICPLGICGFMSEIQA